jgi:putative membrane protein
MSQHEDRGALAEDRTDLARDRTVLASERTYASWMRTGLASIAVALGFRALLRDFEPTWVVKLIASTFVLAGAAVIWLAYRRACTLAARLGDGQTTSLPISRMGWLSVTLVSAALALGILLWIL